MAKAPAKADPETQAPEIFADGVASVAIRRNVARLTLVSERVAIENPDQTDRVVVGHMAMSLAGFLDLQARMQNIVDQMRERGAVVPRENAEAPEAKPAAKPAAKAKRAPRRKKA